MTKNLLLAVAAMAALASCTKDPTLDERLAGTWNLSDLSLAGTVITPIGALPITITDSLIRPDNFMDLAINEDETQTIYWNMDVRGLITGSERAAAV